MAKGKLYEFAILHHPTPTKDQNDRGETPKSVVIKMPTVAMAVSPDQVSVLAARQIPDEFIDKLEEVEIVVRPF